MDMQAQLGGAASHWGGPSAFAELMAATFGLMFAESATKKQDWFELFNFVNDAGHCENGLYALRANYQQAGLSMASLKGFRSINSGLTGHGEAHLFPEGVLISNGPLGSGIPQAQGLAIADQLAGRKRTTVCAISDGGCMEGEARESLAAIPGLAQRGLVAPFILVISDNNTKLSGRIDQDSFSMAPSFKALHELGWKVLHLNNGHDLEACWLLMMEAMQSVQENPRLPVAIHARTIKGFGVDKTAKSASGGHGFPLKEAKELKAFLTEIYQGQPVPDEFLAWAQELESFKPEVFAGDSSFNKEIAELRKVAGSGAEKVQAGVARALIKAREQGLPVVSVTSDLPGSTGVADFHKKFPTACVDVGVAEANMVSVGIGLAKNGFIPVVDTFSQFGVTKGNLPLIMAALSQGPVIGIFSHAGFQDAADGASHQALAYFAQVGGIPHTDCYALASSAEAEALVGQAIQHFRTNWEQGKTPRSQIFFLGRENFAKSYSDGGNYKLGQAELVFSSAARVGKGSLVIAAAGALLPEAKLACQALESRGFGVRLLNPSIINRPDVKTFATHLRESGGRLLTVEDHQANCGMGAMLASALLNQGVQINRFCSLGVRDEFGQSAYQALELYRKHGLDATGILAAALKLVE